MENNVNHVITPIIAVRPGRRGYNITCIIIDTKREKPINQKGQPLFSILVSDASGSIILSLWGEEYNHLNPGDMLKLTDIVATLRNNRCQLVLERTGKIRRYGEDLLLMSPNPNMSHVKWKEVDTKSNLPIFEPAGQFPYTGTSSTDTMIPWEVYAREPEAVDPRRHKHQRLV
ncbi:hypothetical protein BC833DRAFT_594503 [Globomyces pollinis-pini]|nr:hypothetical protein BC833DRAFT_594503 [Globomyces pollinis-pini]